MSDARIAGALFDFAAYLTTRPVALTVSHTHDAYPIVEALAEWAATRNLNLEVADVQNWDKGAI